MRQNIGKMKNFVDDFFSLPPRLPPLQSIYDFELCHTDSEKLASAVTVDTARRNFFYKNSLQILKANRDHRIALEL